MRELDFAGGLAGRSGHGGTSLEEFGGDDSKGRERDGRLDADNPLEDAKFGFCGERFQVGTRHCLRANCASNGFGLSTFNAGRFECAGGAERVESGPVHGQIRRLCFAVQCTAKRAVLPDIISRRSGFR